MSHMLRPGNDAFADSCPAGAERCLHQLDRLDILAAEIGLRDAAGPGIRVYLVRHPRLLGWIAHIFGFAAERPLSSERLESIRRFALAEALAGSHSPALELALRWRRAATSQMSKSHWGA